MQAYFRLILCGPKQRATRINACPRMVSIFIMTAFEIHVHQKKKNLMFPTPPPIGLGWLECYCHSQIHTAHLQTSHICSECPPCTVTHDTALLMF